MGSHGKNESIIKISTWIYSFLQVPHKINKTKQNKTKQITNYPFSPIIEREEEDVREGSPKKKGHKGQGERRVG